MLKKVNVPTLVATLAVLWAVHNVGALDPARKFLNFDQ